MFDNDTCYKVLSISYEVEDAEEDDSGNIAT
jgi:hypothetical protein